MTRRRFQHCQNEKCNRRLWEFPAHLEAGEPAQLLPAFCEACLAMQAKGPGPEYFAMGRREGYLRSAIIAGLGLVGWLVVQVVIWWRG